jgi:hypothetical protein
MVAVLLAVKIPSGMQCWSSIYILKCDKMTLGDFWTWIMLAADTQMLAGFELCLLIMHEAYWSWRNKRAGLQLFSKHIGPEGECGCQKTTWIRILFGNVDAQFSIFMAYRVEEELAMDTN